MIGQAADGIWVEMGRFIPFERFIPFRFVAGYVADEGYILLTIPKAEIFRLIGQGPKSQA